MSNCPNVEILEEALAAGELPPGVAAHVDQCETCSALVETIRFDNELARELREFVADDEFSADAAGGYDISAEYKLVREIQRGGQGIVLEAVHLPTGDPVAIKMLLAGPFSTSRSVKRFQREIKLASTLRHDNIVALREAGKGPGGTRFFAMELVDGVDLTNYLVDTAEGGALSTTDKLRLFVKICEAVEHAHAHGIVHRDLKPSNVLIDPLGEPKVLDFGLAKHLDLEDSAATQLTASADLLGSPAWAAPEQFAGAQYDADVRTDVHGLGLVLYHMLTGEHAFPIPATIAALIQTVHEHVPDAPSRHMQLEPRSAELDAIVLKALEKNVDQRYKDVVSFQADCVRYLRGRGVRAPTRGWLFRAKRSILRRKRSVAAVAVAIGVVAFGGPSLLRALRSPVAPLAPIQETPREAELSAWRKVLTLAREGRLNPDFLTRPAFQRLRDSYRNSACRASLSTGYELVEIGVSRDGKNVAVADKASGALTVYWLPDLEGGDNGLLLAGCTALDFDDRGSRIVYLAPTPDGGLRPALWPDEGAVGLADLAAITDVRAVAFGSGDTFYVLRKDRLERWDTVTGLCDSAELLDPTVINDEFSPTGLRVVDADHVLIAGRAAAELRHAVSLERIGDRLEGQYTTHPGDRRGYVLKSRRSDVTPSIVGEEGTLVDQDPLSFPPGASVVTSAAGVLWFMSDRFSFAPTAEGVPALDWEGSARLAEDGRYLVVLQEGDLRVVDLAAFDTWEAMLPSDPEQAVGLVHAIDVGSRGQLYCGETREARRAYYLPSDGSVYPLKITMTPRTDRFCGGVVLEESNLIAVAYHDRPGMSGTGKGAVYFARLDPFEGPESDGTLLLKQVDTLLVGPSHLAAEPGRERVAIPSQDGTVYLYTPGGLSGGERPYEITTQDECDEEESHMHCCRASSASWSRAGGRLAAGLGDGRIAWVDADDEKRSSKSESGGRRVLCVIAGHDVLASGHETGVLNLWRWGAAKPVTVQAHDHDLNALALSSDGNLLASADSDGTVKLWDVSNWLEPEFVGTIDTGRKLIHSLMFGEEADELYVGREHGPRLYDLGAQDDFVASHITWACGKLGLDRDGPAARNLRKALGASK